MLITTDGKDIVELYIFVKIYVLLFYLSRQYIYIYHKKKSHTQSTLFIIWCCTGVSLCHTINSLSATLFHTHSN